MAWLTAGMLGCGGAPGGLFFPPRCLEVAGLDESIVDHGHQGVSVQTPPESSFEMAQAGFFFEFLMRVFTDPSDLDAVTCPFFGATRQSILLF